MFYTHPAKVLAFAATFLGVTYMAAAPPREYATLITKHDEQLIRETALEVQKAVDASKTVEENKASICSQFTGDKQTDCESLLNELFNDFSKNVKAGNTEQLPKNFDVVKVFARRVAKNTPAEQLLKQNAHHH